MSVTNPRSEVPVSSHQIPQITQISVRTITARFIRGNNDKSGSDDVSHTESSATDLRIVVHKGRRTLELFSEGLLVKSYRIGLGFSPVEDKQVEGDGATPEGEFYVFVKNSKSSYYLSLGISYPNQEDAERGLRAELITTAQYHSIVSAITNKMAPPQNTKLGGLIYIHGDGSHSDWTRGCVALENLDMKEIYDAVDVGTPVIILP